jgi:polyisoprenyl-teichoic acid--peptidoglycan teichoic acid transferase
MTEKSGDHRWVRRTWLQRALLVANFVLILACLVSAASLQLAWSKARQIRRVAVGTSLDAPTADVAGDPASVDSPQNYLIVGVDSAEGLAPDDPVRAGRDSGLRSDTIMVLRVDPNASQAQLLSFPRDLWVDIDGGGRAKINSAIELQNGPSRLINTIKENFGVPINHYIQVDFAGFKDIVDAVGGIPIDFPNPVRDQHSLLDQVGPGCVTLTGDNALAYARSRYFETQINGHWVSDPTADLGRIDRQQEFIKLVIQRAIQKGARDPRVLQNLLDGGLRSVQIDERLTVRQILDLATKFKAFTGDQLVTYEVPSSSSTIQGQSVQLVLTGPAQPVLSLFRGVAPDPNDPKTTLVHIQNGTNEAGRAATVADQLRAKGFNIPVESTSDTDFSPTTKVFYAEGAQARGLLVASYLRGPTVLQQAVLFGNDVNVVVGADWQGVLDQPKPIVLDPPGASATPDPAATTTTPAPPDTATTTAPQAALPPPSTVPADRSMFVPSGC